MPGGGKKAVFPSLNLHDHDSVRISANDQDRQKKHLQSRGKSLELKEVTEKEKSDGTSKNKNKPQPCSSKSTERLPNTKSEVLKTPTKSEQKALLKLEQHQIKSDQKAQQKLEKEQAKLEKEHQKEQNKLEKEQKMKAALRFHDKLKSNDLFCTSKDNHVLKTQKSVDLPSLKPQRPPDTSKRPARNSVDMQFNLLHSPSLSPSKPNK